MNIDTSELDGFADDLRAMETLARRTVKPVVHRGANNVKRDWREDASGSRHFRLTESINYDLKETLDGVEAEIGPDRRYPAARLAGIAHFGGVNGGGGTLQDPQAHLDAEGPKMMTALGQAVTEAWKA